MIPTDPDLSVRVGGAILKNPVMTAAGTAGYGQEYSDYIDLSRLGAFVTKGLSYRPREGKPPPRIAETTAGMLNAIGLHNIGIELFARDHLPFLMNKGVPVVVNFFGETKDEYMRAAEELDRLEGLAAVELNISCPNIEKGGMSFGKDPDIVFNLVKDVRRCVQLSLWVKLSPNVTEIADIALSAQEAGADALTVANTFAGMAIDVENKRPRLANITGGLSGPAIKPLALKVVWQTVQAIDIPVIGVGGISNAHDALEFLIAGAVAVQVGTATFKNPMAPIEVIEGIEKHLKEQRLSNIGEIIGSLQIERKGKEYQGGS